MKACHLDFIGAFNSVGHGLQLSMMPTLEQLDKNVRKMEDLLYDRTFYVKAKKGNCVAAQFTS